MSEQKNLRTLKVEEIPAETEELTPEQAAAARGGDGATTVQVQEFTIKKTTDSSSPGFFRQ